MGEGLLLYGRIVDICRYGIYAALSEGRTNIIIVIIIIIIIIMRNM